MHEKLILLLIENEQEILVCIQKALESLRPNGFNASLVIAKTVKEATELLAIQDKFDLILTDLFLSDCKGLETIRKIQAASSDIPILAISESLDEELLLGIMRLGVQGYLSKQELDPEHLHRKIYECIERDKIHKSLQTLSFTDETTGVYNRRGFLKLLEQQVSISKRTGQGFYLFIIDIDYLKKINDTYGHLAGDRAIMDTADCLQLSFRKHDIIGRLGGDEFGVIALNTTVDSLEHMQHKMAYKFKEHNAHSSEPYPLSISIGAVYFDGNVTIKELFEATDYALYLSKKETHLRGGWQPSRQEMGKTD